MLFIKNIVLYQKNAMLFQKDMMLNKKRPTLLKKEFGAFRQFCATFPTQIASTFYFSPPHIATPKKIKRACNPPHRVCSDLQEFVTIKCFDHSNRAACNSMQAIAAGSALIWKFVILL